MREFWAWLRRTRTWPIGDGLRLGDGAALDYLVRDRWLRSAALAHAMHVSVEEAAAATQRLIRSGLVERDQSGRYGAQPTFVPTVAGDAFHADFVAKTTQRARDLFADWSDKDLQAFTHAMRRLAATGPAEQLPEGPRGFSAPKPADAWSDP